MVKNKTTKNGGTFSRRLATLATPLLRASLRGVSRNAANTLHNTLQRPFTASTLRLGPPIPHSLGSGKMSIAPTTSHIEDIEHTDRVRSKIDIRSTMLGTSATTTKIVIGTLIAAFLSVLIGKSKLGTDAIKGIKNETDDVVNKTTETIYNYMVAHASERLQDGDTTIIASMYETLGRHLSPDDRKIIFQHLVIDGVSYGWLAEYDAIIDQWLKNIIKIKGGELPSDNYIINIVNIIQNKVLPVTNGIWYSKRAIKLATGVGLTKADTAHDDYWYTSDGQMETASGARQMLAEDTMLAKIIIGLLSASEVVTTGPIKTIIGNIKPMIRQLIIKIKNDIANHGGEFKTRDKPAAVFPFKQPIADDADDIEMQISELKDLDRYLEKSNKKINQTTSPFKKPRPTTHVPKPIANAESDTSLRSLRDMGAFGSFGSSGGGGGGSRKTCRKCNRRHRFKIRRCRRTIRKL